jgi:hypothetical protein
MLCRQCDVIGCLEAAAWERTMELEGCLEDVLCNACWVRLAARHPEQAACYSVCNSELATPLERPSYRLIKEIIDEEIGVIL